MGVVLAVAHLGRGSNCCSWIALDFIVFEF